MEWLSDAWENVCNTTYWSRGRFVKNMKKYTFSVPEGALGFAASPNMPYKYYYYNTPRVFIFLSLPPSPSLALSSFSANKNTQLPPPLTDQCSGKYSTTAASTAIPPPPYSPLFHHLSFGIHHASPPLVHHLAWVYTATTMLTTIISPPFSCTTRAPKRYQSPLVVTLKLWHHHTHNTMTTIISHRSWRRIVKGLFVRVFVWWFELYSRGHHVVSFLSPSSTATTPLSFCNLVNCETPPYLSFYLSPIHIFCVMFSWIRFDINKLLCFANLNMCLTLSCGKKS